MKKFFPFLLTILLLSCSEQPPLELFSPEAFAFELDNGWELNASINVKGFVQEEKNDLFNTNLSYKIDLVTPEQDTLKEFDFGSIVEKNKEESLDATIEVQAEIDSNFSPGNYFLLFYVKDDNSGRDTNSVKTFILEKN